MYTYNIMYTSMYMYIVYEFIESMEIQYTYVSLVYTHQEPDCCMCQNSAGQPCMGVTPPY